MYNSTNAEERQKGNIKIMSDFYANLQKTQDNVSITENGAVGYKTTGKELVDFNFKVSSYRNNVTQGVEDFKKVMASGNEYTLKYLMYLRDAREGLGERALFRACLTAFLASNVQNKDEMVNVLLTSIPEYGRYDDLLVMYLSAQESVRVRTVEFIRKQLSEDFKNFKAGKSISLLAKWLPSANASAKATRTTANKLIKDLGTSPKEYRKTLSALRAYLDVTEVKTCAKDWEDIDYNTVPSKANIKYKNAFLKNDETRRREYLAKLSAGVEGVKINSSVNFPHDVLHMYTQSRAWSMTLGSYDEATEQLWKALKEAPGLKNTIVVRDDSGSMTSTVGNTNLTAYEVATALGIYCAEHNSDAYKNKIITFSETPRYLDFSDPKRFGSLHSKYKFLLENSEVANTNVEAVFDLILKTAVENRLDASELPEEILILSDMEFDRCATTSSAYSSYFTKSPVSMSLFNTISAKYAQFGYKLPKLVFWNLCSRTGTIPCKENDSGVLLVSGFSQNVLSLVMTGKTDPYDALVDILVGERYAKVPLVTFSNGIETTSTIATRARANVRKKGTRSRVATPEFLK